MKQVLIMVACDAQTQERLQTRFGDRCRFVFAAADPALLAETLPTAEIIVGEPDAEQLAAAGKLRWLQLTWAGVDRYSRMEAFPEQVVLTNASGAFGIVISEYVIGALLSLYRDFPRMLKNQQKHCWQEIEADTSVFGKTALILGTGNLGSSIARKLKAFDAYTIGVKRRPASEPVPGFDELHRTDELDALLPRADILVCCVPGTRETEGLLSLERLQRMKKDAVLINVGRGGLIANRDLVAVLSSGHLRGAALDVFEAEPLPEDSPLWDMENVIVTPHIAGPSFGSNLYTQGIIWNIFTDNLERYLNAEKLQNVVDLKIGY